MQLLLQIAEKLAILFWVYIYRNCNFKFLYLQEKWIFSNFSFTVRFIITNLYMKSVKITTLQLKFLKLKCGNLYTLFMHNLVIMNRTVKEKFENIHFPWRYKSLKYIFYILLYRRKTRQPTSAICNNILQSYNEIIIIYSYY